MRRMAVLEQLHHAGDNAWKSTTNFHHGVAAPPGVSFGGPQAILLVIGPRLRFISTPVNS